MDDRLLTAEQAAARLGVRRQTLYAYVSRGLLDRQRGVDGRSWFDPRQLDALTTRGRRRRAAAAPLAVRTAVSVVDGGRLYYRGIDAVALARTRRFEDVAELLWRGTLHPASPWQPDTAALRAARRAARRGSLVDRLTAATASTPVTGDRSDVDTARTLFATVVAALSDARGTGHVTHLLWPVLTDLPPTRSALRALDAAMIVSADHGVIRSTGTARIVAASGADLGACLLAALGPARASVASSAMDPARRLLRAVAGGGDARELLARTALPHVDPRYPAGDPRAVVVLDAVRSAATVPEVARVVDAIHASGDQPSSDVALAALAHAFDMRDDAAQAIALVARMAGWIAHAIEERDDPTPFRFSATYTGPAPERPSARRTLDAVQAYLAR